MLDSGQKFACFFSPGQWQDNWLASDTFDSFDRPSSRIKIVFRLSIVRLFYVSILVHDDYDEPALWQLWTKSGYA